MFIRFIQNIISNANIYFKTAFGVYLLASLVSIFCGIISSILILDIDFFYDFIPKDSLYECLFLGLTLVLLSLILESLDPSRLHKKISKNILRLMICFVLALASIPLYLYTIAPFMTSINSGILIDEEFYYRFIALIIALSLVFVVLNLRDYYKSFLHFVVFFFIIYLFFYICMILLGILFFSILLLFRPDYDVLKIFLICGVIFYTLTFLFFIGKEAMLNHYSIESKENVNINEFNSKILNYFFIVLNIFSYIYSLLLLLYFICLAFGLLDSQYSAIHLIVWFSMFGLFLVWLNRGFEKYNHKSNNILLTLLFILMLIASYSITIRILEYGITPNRYFIILACFYLFISIICSFLFKYSIKYLLLLLALLCIISTFGAFNAINVSIKSQIKQIESLELVESNYTRISDIYSFLDDYDATSGLEEYQEFITEQNKINNNIKNIARYNERYETFDTQNIDIKGYDRLFNIYRFYTKSDGYVFEFDDDYKSFSVYKDDKLILKIDDFFDFVKKVNKKVKDSNIINITKNGVSFRFNILKISIDKNQNKIISVDFYLLIKE